MQSRAKVNSFVNANVAVQPALTFDSLPGATDIGYGRYYDNQGLIKDFT